MSQNSEYDSFRDSSTSLLKAEEEEERIQENTEIKQLSARSTVSTNEEDFPVHLIHGVFQNQFDNLFSFNVTPLQSILSRVMYSLNEHTNTILELNKRIDSLQSELEREKGENEDLSSLVRQLEARVLNAVTIDDIRDMKENIESKEKFHSDSLSQLQSEIQTVSEEVLRVNDEVVKVSTNSSENSRKIDDFVQTVNNKLASVDDQLKTFQTSTGKLLDVADDLITKRDVLRHIHELQANLELKIDFVDNNAEKSLQRTDLELREKIANEVQSMTTILQQEIEMNVENFTMSNEGSAQSKSEKKIQALTKDITKIQQDIKDVFDILYIKKKGGIDGIQDEILDIRTDFSDVGTLLRTLTNEVAELRSVSHFHSIGHEFIPFRAKDDIVLYPNEGFDQRSIKSPSKVVENELPLDEETPKKVDIVQPTVVDTIDKGAIMRKLAEHSEQLAHLLCTKADIGALAALEDHIDKTTEEQPLMLNPIEINQLKQVLTAGGTNAIKEYNKMRKEMHKQILRSFADQLQPEQKESESVLKTQLEQSMARVQFRCLACDNVLAGDTTAPTKGETHIHTNTNQPKPTSAGNNPQLFFNLPPQITFRRWQIREIMKASRQNQQQATRKTLAPIAKR